MQSTTRRLATHVQQALLALPDEIVFETLGHWIAMIKDRDLDAEVLANYSEALGYRVSSGESGQTYDNLEALYESEPEAEDVSWIPPDPSRLRAVIHSKQPKQVYHQIINLAGEALRQTDFAAGWPEPPGEQCNGYAFMRCLVSYLELRKEGGDLSTEEYAQQYREAIEALGVVNREEQEDDWRGTAFMLTNEHAVHFYVTMKEANEQQQMSLRQALQHYDFVFSPDVEMDIIRGSVFYVPGRQADLKMLRRVRRLLGRWQDAERVTWTERKEKPKKRILHKKHKQKVRRNR